MIHQNVVHLARRNLLAAAIDDLLQSPCDGEVAVIVEHALVAGVEPAMGEGFGVGFRVVLISRRNVIAANDHFAGRVGGQQGCQPHP